MGVLAKMMVSRINRLAVERPMSVYGHVSRYDGQMIECNGFPANIGALCQVETDAGESAIAEVIGFHRGNNLLSLHDFGARIRVGARVTLFDDGAAIPVGDGLLGRVTDALGVPLDDGPALQLDDRWPLMGKSLNPLTREPVAKPLDVGVRVINSMMTVGRGQRIGIIAGSGVGKSVLLGMMSRYTTADIVVVGMIGERGREVGAFVNTILDGEARKRTAVVAVPADRSPLLRIRGAERATAIAEYYRDRGKNVLLIMDSLTRVAHARREIGLALGEQPTSKGYPPSVVSMIPRLVERTGNGGKGQVPSPRSIPCLPMVTMRMTLWLIPRGRSSMVTSCCHGIRRRWGVYPAVDVSSSVSRVMNDIVGKDHQDAARKFRRLVSLYMENRDLLLMGGYVPGQDAELDLAVSLWPALMKFIQQQESEKADFASSEAELRKLMAS